MKTTKKNLSKFSGFTLIELLVVVAIIGILAALLIPTVTMVKNQANRDAVQTNLKRISSALESYNQDYGDYPPSSLENYTDEELNDMNNGSEALTACLMTEQKNGVYLEWQEDQYGNTDGDSTEENLTGWFFGDNQLRELVDTWQNPIVYIHYRDYPKADELGKYKLRTGTKVEIEPAKNQDTATFYKPGAFQIWSVGPDLKNENGSGDDVTIW